MPGGGYPRRPGGEWPIAAITRSLDRPRGLDEQPGGDTWFMRADPVHARAGLGEITLFHSHELTISGEEAKTLVETINNHFEEESWHIEALNPYRWYIECSAVPGINTVPLSRVTGPVVEEVLPRGEQAARWRSVLNEIQMLLHTHPLNEKRRSERTLPINSVWLWGVGKQPVLGSSRWDTLCSDLHLGASIAATAGFAYANLSGGLTGVLGQESGMNRGLVVIDYLDLPSRRLDVEAWRTGIQRVAEEWFHPLVGALRSGVINALEISLGDGTAFHLKRSHIRRWWRRRRSFAALAAK